MHPKHSASIVTTSGVEPTPSAPLAAEESPGSCSYCSIALLLHEQSALLAAVKNIPTAMVLSWQHAWTALNLQHLQSTAPMKHVPLAQAALSQPEVPDQPTGQHVCSTSLELLHDRRLSQNLSIPRVAARRFLDGRMSYSMSSLWLSVE